jgi:ubiquinone/menaquinone biosynthesis C-methylase UbiE
MSTSTVRAYYERNTRFFRAIGIGRRARAIHRAVWAGGVRDYASAMRYHHTRIHAALVQRAAPGVVRVLDIGCGVGGTLLDLSESYAGELCAAGVSISPTQVHIANTDATAHGAADRCAFLEADFMHLPFQGAFDLAIAIESLVHAPDIAHAIGEAAAALAPGGELIICDDFLTTTTPARPQSVEAFQRGWHAPGLTTVAALTQHAARVGLRLIEQQDLTPALRLVRLPDAIVTPLLRLGALLPRRHLFLHSNIGSLALQHCLARGMIGYYWLRFVR